MRRRLPLCRARLRALATLPRSLFKPLLALWLALCCVASFCAASSASAAELIIHERETPLRLSPSLGDEPPSTPIPTAMTPTPPRTQPTPVEEDLPRIATIDLTAPPTDLWQRIRNGFAMPNLESPLVADRQAYYLNRPAALKVMVQRSRRYLYHIVSELEKRGMPTELALLPMVESAYNPLAQSPAKALGMWQFIPSTGRNYNLTQNWWLDQRRDIIASTNAALDYLQTIYEMNGDWHLALASYNWGENAVAKAVVRNQAKGLPTDYLHLTMPGETRYYVPKLQALKNIIADPALFGIQLDPIPNKPYFETVDMPATMDVATAAKLAEIPLDEFMALNPAYSRPLMPDNGNSSLVLPADRVSIFQANLVRHENQDKPLSLWKTAVLKPKEKLDAVAARYGISTARLKQINSIGPRTKIVPGMNLLVPASPAAAQEIAAHMPQPPVEQPAPAQNGHTNGHGGSTNHNGRHSGKPAKGSQARHAVATKSGKVVKGKKPAGKTASTKATPQAAAKKKKH
ncbi:MAG: lytic transglycosylase [Rhodocyclaceae bacterium]|nr:MAG: lytic transglycosylase [Rhodocyclaceae bacterium]